MLSDGFWTTRLAADPGVVGRTVRVNGHALTVVGVAPPKFGGVYALLHTDAWVPMAVQPQLTPGDDLLTNPRPGWLQLFARVRGGVGRDVVQRELSRLTGQYAAEGNGTADDRRYTIARVESKAKLGKHRWMLAWLARYRRLTIRYGGRTPAPRHRAPRPPPPRLRPLCWNYVRRL